MTIKNLETELLIVNKTIQKIFELTSYQQTHNISGITFTPDSPDEVMKYFEFQSIFSHLDFIHSLLSYLQKPIKCTGIIERTPHGTYKIGNTTLSVGDIIEILTADEELGAKYWRPYIIKSSSTELDNVNARFRGERPPHVH